MLIEYWNKTRFVGNGGVSVLWYILQKGHLQIIELWATFLRTILLCVIQYLVCKYYNVGFTPSCFPPLRAYWFSSNKSRGSLGENIGYLLSLGMLLFDTSPLQLIIPSLSANVLNISDTEIFWHLYVMLAVYLCIQSLVFCYTVFLNLYNFLDLEVFNFLPVYFLKYLLPLCLPTFRKILSIFNSSVFI